MVLFLFSHPTEWQGFKAAASPIFPFPLWDGCEISWIISDLFLSPTREINSSRKVTQSIIWVARNNKARSFLYFGLVANVASLLGSTFLQYVRSGAFNLQVQGCEGWRALPGAAMRVAIWSDRSRGSRGGVFRRPSRAERAPGVARRPEEDPAARARRPPRLGSQSLVGDCSGHFEHSFCRSGITEHSARACIEPGFGSADCLRCQGVQGHVLGPKFSEQSIVLFD